MTNGTLPKAGTVCPPDGSPFAAAAAPGNGTASNATETPPRALREMSPLKKKLADANRYLSKATLPGPFHL
jgi:hypothetical protein